LAFENPKILEAFTSARRKAETGE